MVGADGSVGRMDVCLPACPPVAVSQKVLLIPQRVGNDKKSNVGESFEASKKDLSDDADDRSFPHPFSSHTKKSCPPKCFEKSGGL